VALNPKIDDTSNVDPSGITLAGNAEGGNRLVAALCIVDG